MPDLSTGLVLANVCSFWSMTWVFQLARVLIHRRDFVQLAGLADAPPTGGWPGLSVVIAARDEEAMIALATRSLLDQDYPDLEVIVVDDRSEDRTGAILDDLARDDPRLRVVHVRGLPDGWLGKTNAMQRGADVARSTWILFTDADVVFAPGALRRALAYAEAGRVDHLVILPDAITEGPGERSFMAVFALLFSLRYTPWRVDDPSSRSFVGIGAFNLVRAEAFRAIGGLRRVAMSVDDDVRLGQALKYAGYRAKALGGTGQVSVRWQEGLGGLIRGVEKNYFAGIDYRPGVAVVSLVLVLLTTVGPFLGLFIGPWWTRATCGLGIVSAMLLLRFVSPSTRVGPRYGLTLPIGGLTIAYAFARSVALTLARRGVSWRGRSYPLGSLRAHVRHRNHWLGEVWHSTR